MWGGRFKKSIEKNNHDINEIVEYFWKFFSLSDDTSSTPKTFTITFTIFRNHNVLKLSKSLTSICFHKNFLKSNKCRMKFKEWLKKKLENPMKKNLEVEIFYTTNPLWKHGKEKCLSTFSIHWRYLYKLFSLDSLNFPFLNLRLFNSKKNKITNHFPSSSTQKASNLLPHMKSFPHEIVEDFPYRRLEHVKVFMFRTLRFLGFLFMSWSVFNGDKCAKRKSLNKLRNILRLLCFSFQDLRGKR